MFGAVTLNNKVGKLRHCLPANACHSLYEMVVVGGKCHVNSGSLAAFAPLRFQFCRPFFGFFGACCSLLPFAARCLFDCAINSAAGVNAGKIVGEIARATGANGGGRPNFAQGGIKDSSKLEEVLAKIESEVKE